MARDTIKSLRREIDDLRRCIDALIASWPLKQQQTETIPIPSAAPAIGCVCPVGAEINCGSGICPRRRLPGFSWISSNVTETN